MAPEPTRVAPTKSRRVIRASRPRDRACGCGAFFFISMPLVITRLWAGRVLGGQARRNDPDVPVPGAPGVQSPANSRFVQRIHPRKEIGTGVRRIREIQVRAVFPINGPIRLS